MWHRAALAFGVALLLGDFASPARADSDPPVVVIVLENHGYGPNDVGVKGDTTKFVVGSSTPIVSFALVLS